MHETQQGVPVSGVPKYPYNGRSRYAVHAAPSVAWVSQTLPTDHNNSSPRAVGPAPRRGLKCQWMKPNALESNREEGLDLVASLSQMLNIWRKALGCERIVRTPKFMYFPRKNISVMYPS